MNVGTVLWMSQQLGVTMTKRRDALAARREALGFTQETFAQELGVELSTVGRWERGVLTPQPWRRSNVAKVLKLSLEELDSLLNPAPPSRAGHSLVTRREAMVDVGLLSSAVIAGDVLDKHDAYSPLVGTDSPAPSGTVEGISSLVAGVHRAYQAARYGEVARQLPSVTSAVQALMTEGAAKDRRQASGLQCSVFIAAAKLAIKVGNAEAGWAAAEQAQVAAEAAEDVWGQAAAAHQRTCALLRAGLGEDAEHVAVVAADGLRGSDPQSVTWRGALTLISAIIAARRNDTVEARRRLDHADVLAQRLGTDANIGWTAFGPTNVQIHRVSAAIALGDPYGALATAERVDIATLPVGLHGRQAQFHLDSSWAHAQLGEDPQAVIHLLDTERVAPELIGANPSARALIQDLLTREHRRAVPGLRGLALRAGVAT
ncbi:MAG: putative transcription factor, like protein [Amycolatopsis sp.]|uniref:helix-turn-helix domain-containing protein n=1 Tax=Amycolatopsis sp. TaxID=37632 RepID=UPI00261BD3E7|nr:helix-turn-helix transcriptional regulator [Amycolatopsis sp.]MCU1680251.1 putative transcription factor, like protein [Amycolatopsis sp.]